MYKKASKFRQSAPHGAVGRDQSLVPALRPKASARYAKIMRYLLERSHQIGATELIMRLDDYRLARLIVALCTETTKPNDWLYSVCVEVDDRLCEVGSNIKLSRYERNVAETVIPEIINRARRSLEGVDVL